MCTNLQFDQKLKKEKYDNIHVKNDSINVESGER